MNRPVLYTQTGCPDSARVKSWLQQHGIPFTERNVTDDAAAMAELAASPIFATPLLLVGNQHVFGYRPTEIARALGIPT